MVVSKMTRYCKYCKKYKTNITGTDCAILSGIFRSTNKFCGIYHILSAITLLSENPKIKVIRRLFNQDIIMIAIEDGEIIFRVNHKERNFEVFHIQSGSRISSRPLSGVVIEAVDVVDKEFEKLTSEIVQK